jgi:hypothetical protein
MKRLLIAFACFAFFAPGLVQSGLAQSANEPATRDDVILYLRTMHTHDLFQRTMEVQSQAMQQMMHDQMVQDKGSVPADFDARRKKLMDDLVKNMPVDEITNAMIPAYQNHFTKSDIEAMNAFYSSPVGQKVIEELPAVMQEGMQAAMPIMNNYLTEWKGRMQQEMQEMQKTPSRAPTPGALPKN